MLIAWFQIYPRDPNSVLALAVDLIHYSLFMIALNLNLIVFNVKKISKECHKIINSFSNMTLKYVTSSPVCAG